LQRNVNKKRKRKIIAYLPNIRALAAVPVAAPLHCASNVSAPAIIVSTEHDTAL